MNSIIPTLFATEIQDIKKRYDVITQLSSHIHIDIMDGVFVTKKTPEIILEKKIGIREIHLMVEYPGEYFTHLQQLEPDIIIVHHEAKMSAHNAKEFCTQLRAKLYVGINPQTQSTQLSEWIEYIDGFLLMGHAPGVENVALETQVLLTISELLKYNKHIQIDGGINNETILKAKVAGANAVNVGSYLSNAKDPQATYEELVRLWNTKI